MPTPKMPPPLRPLAVSVIADKVRVVVPVAALTVLLLPLTIWFAPAQPPGPTPLPIPLVPLLESTPTAPMPALAALLPGRLPTPGPNQKRAGTCDPERSQEEMSGGCWVKTEHPPPCPRGKQWEHEGRCWLPVAEAKPVPTSGEPRPVGVAAP